MIKMFKRIKFFVCAFGLLSIAITSCQDEMEEYYKEPNSIKGSIYEILEQRGNYSVFLQAVDRCEYKALLQGRSILTVMAPDDESMTAYLMEQYRTTDVSQIDVDELKKLVGFHLLYYAFDKDKLVNFRPLEGDGATEEEKEVDAGLYYKFRTRSQDAPQMVYPDCMTDANGAIVDTMGVEVCEYHLERFLPIFSYKMFETKLIDAAYNYNYFFGEDAWAGADGFNVSNAKVEEYAIIAKNGYVYMVDDVVKPLETIHAELENNPNYSLYLQLYDEYDYYSLNEELTKLYGNESVSYYQRMYESGDLGLPNIASEWPVTSYSDMASLARLGYTVFAPTNAAFEEFYREYWGDEGTGYPSEVNYDSISADAIGYLLSNSIANDVVFPEQITKGEIVNNYTETVINFPVDDVPQENRKICVNGMLYGQSILTPPAVFGSVTGPAYKYKNNSIFLKMLTASDMQSTLTVEEVSFIMLYPNNTQFENNLVWYDSINDKLKYGVVGNASASNLGSASQSNYVGAHIVTLDGAMEELPTGAGISVFRTLSTNYKLYLYVKDGKLTNSFKYNDLLEYDGHRGITKDSVYTTFSPLLFRNGPWSNGHCYRYDEEMQEFLLPGSNENAINPNFIPLIYSHRNDENTLFQGFIQLLMLANMIDEQAQSMNFMTENCMMLVPVTEAIKAAIVEGRMPYVTVPAGVTVDATDFWKQCIVPEDGSDEQVKFQHYMLQYFLPESTAPCSNYPYPGWGEDVEGDGGIPSIADMTVTPALSAYIYIYDKGDGTMSAKVKGMTQEIPFIQDYDCLPFVYDDGAVQFIDGVFEDCWPNAN